jgi:hypothetical protein
VMGLRRPIIHTAVMQSYLGQVLAIKNHTLIFSEIR